MKMRRSTGFNFDICYQDHESEQHSKDFNWLLFIKKLLIKKFEKYNSLYQC